MENDALIPSLGSQGTPPPLAVKQMKCVQHRDVDAAHQCRSCGAYICATCDFALPNGVHLCPGCATKPNTELGPKRKRSMIWSYVCAGGATVGFIVGMALAAQQGQDSAVNAQAIGMLFSIFVMIPSITGLGIGIGAIDRRHHNPASLWIATIWNGLILGGFLLLGLVGLMM